jgi:hypothetical protein
MAEDKPAGDAPVANQTHFEDPQAPIIYADDCWGGGALNGDNITLTFAAKILNHTQNPPLPLTKTVLRLVLPRRAATGLADFIKDFLSQSNVARQPADANKTVN